MSEKKCFHATKGEFWYQNYNNISVTKMIRIIRIMMYSSLHIIKNMNKSSHRHLQDKLQKSIYLTRLSLAIHFHVMDGIEMSFSSISKMARFFSFS